MNECLCKNILINVNKVIVKMGDEERYIKTAEYLDEKLREQYGEYYICDQVNQDKECVNVFYIEAFYRNIPELIEVTPEISNLIEEVYKEFGNCVQRTQIASYTSTVKVYPTKECCCNLEGRGSIDFCNYKILDEKEIMEIIDNNECARLSLVENDQPYVIPMHYETQIGGNRIIFKMHTKETGIKMQYMENNAKVCIQIEAKYHDGMETVTIFGKIKMSDGVYKQVCKNDILILEVIGLKASGRKYFYKDNNENIKL